MDTNKDYKELWNDMIKEQEAKLEELDEERRMERSSLLDDIKEQFNETTDWTEEKWNEFTTKLSRWSDGE